MEETYEEPLVINDKPLPKIVESAIEFGHIVPGWCLQDYLVHAVQTQGYETVLIHGVQGSGKSCLMLQTGFWIC